jgi:hypothetical protein
VCRERERVRVTIRHPAQMDVALCLGDRAASLMTLWLTEPDALLHAFATCSVPSGIGNLAPRYDKDRVRYPPGRRFVTSTNGTALHRHFRMAVRGLAG